MKLSILSVSFILLSLLGCETYQTGVMIKEEAYRYQKEGRLAQEKNDWSSAISCYKKASYLDPYNPDIYNDLAIAYEHENSYKLAETAYKKAIDVDRNYLPAYYNLAHLYEKTGDIDKALSYYKLRIKLSKDKNDPWVWKCKQKIYFYEKKEVKENVKKEN